MTWNFFFFFIFSYFAYVLNEYENICCGNLFICVFFLLRGNVGSGVHQQKWENWKKGKGERKTIIHCSCFKRSQFGRWHANDAKWPSDVDCFLYGQQQEKITKKKKIFRNELINSWMFDRIDKTNWFIDQHGRRH